ncbi:nitroreductase [Azospirillum sp.]|uniref:nitroreductase n=1 Tax=Azospirillum sp. TaxID=34012 RepID=UPI003D750D59
MSIPPESVSPHVSVFDAIRTRRSVRAFTGTPVPRGVVEEILRLAARAPSGSNIQPWKVHVVAGRTRDALCRDLLDAHDRGLSTDEEFHYYPRSWRDPYLARRRRLGLDLYGLLGIGKGDKERMDRQYARNYTFFDAPVGLFVTIDRDLEVGSWLDLGMFVQSIMLAARGFGLHTCPQQSFSKHHRLIRKHLPIPDADVLVCGIALGHADEAAAENRLETHREPLERFAAFHWNDPA